MHASTHKQQRLNVTAVSAALVATMTRLLGNLVGFIRVLATYLAFSLLSWYFLKVVTVLKRLNSANHCLFGSAVPLNRKSLSFAGMSE